MKNLSPVKEIFVMGEANIQQLLFGPEAFTPLEEMFVHETDDDDSAVVIVAPR